MSLGPARFAWVLNLDAELELAHRTPGYTPPGRLVRDLERHAVRSRELLGPGDVLVSPGVVGTIPNALGRAWCPTPLALSKLRAAGVEPEPHPALSVLYRVNHRRFACELGGGLGGQRYVENRAELEALLSSGGRPWLLKRPLAFAGRGQLRLEALISEKQWSWIDASLRSDGLVIEPLVKPTLELSLHGFVWQDGRFELGNICAQDVSPRGVFQGVRRVGSHELDGTEAESLLEQGQRVAIALFRAGYFGPFGIDAYRYRCVEGGGFCTLGEINARYTMGFTTGFTRHPSQLMLT